MSYSKLHNPIRTDEGRSGAVQAVLFQTGPITWQETKQGSIIFSGEAATFHDWEFRARMKMAGCTDPSKYAENMRVCAFNPPAFICDTVEQRPLGFHLE